MEQTVYTLTFLADFATYYAFFWSLSSIQAIDRKLHTAYRYLFGCRALAHQRRAATRVGDRTSERADRRVRALYRWVSGLLLVPRPRFEGWHGWACSSRPKPSDCQAMDASPVRPDSPHRYRSQRSCPEPGQNAMEILRQVGRRGDGWAVCVPDQPSINLGRWISVGRGLCLCQPIAISNEPEFDGIRLGCTLS